MEQRVVYFGPLHLPDLAAIVFRYLAKNERTKHLAIGPAELSGVIHNLDLDILTARLEGSPAWGMPNYYQKLRRLPHRYRLTFEQVICDILRKN